MRARPEDCSRVLIIDDDPDIRDSLQELLEMDGFRCTVVENGRAGLERLSRERFDVALLDWRMSEMGGGEFLSAREAHEELRRTPVLVLTAMRLKDAELNPFTAVTMLTKPFDFDELLRAIERACDKSASSAA